MNNKQTSDPPTHKEIVGYYTRQVELAELRARLVKAGRDEVVHDVERLRALAVLAEMIPTTGKTTEEKADDKDSPSPV